MSKSKRLSMPTVTAFIDELRAVFGVEHIDAQIRLGMQGAQTFHAAENGSEVGTRFNEPTRYVTSHQIVIRPILPEAKGKKC